MATALVVWHGSVDNNGVWIVGCVGFVVCGSVVVKSKIVVSWVVWSPTVGVVCCSEVVKSIIVVPSVVSTVVVLHGSEVNSVIWVVG